MIGIGSKKFSLIESFMTNYAGQFVSGYEGVAGFLTGAVPLLTKAKIRFANRLFHGSMVASRP